MGKVDRTFSEVSAYGSVSWCAETLGRSTDWFRKERDTLESMGFPKVDLVTGLTLKADVQAWISRRRKYSDRAIVEASEDTIGGINYDKF